MIEKMAVPKLLSTIGSVITEYISKQAKEMKQLTFVICLVVLCVTALRAYQRYDTQQQTKILMEQMSIFIQENNNIDLHKQCGNDPVYMEQYRAAESRLDLIESLAKQVGNQAVIDTFVNPRRGLTVYSSEC
jgi:hypothetical protein